MSSNLHILHTSLQTRLQHLRIPSKQPHHQPPTHRRKNRPRIPHQPLLHLRRQSQPAGPLALHTEFRKAEHHPREDIDDNLLVDGALARSAAAEDIVAAQQAGEEGVWGCLFLRGGGVAEEEEGGFVDDGESGEVAGVLAGGLEDEL